MTRITVEEASKQFGIPKNGIRIMVQRGLLPIGDAVVLTNKRTTYYLFQELIDKYIDEKLSIIKHWYL